MKKLNMPPKTNNMSELDKISIIVPVHNGSKYLKKLFKSINSQTYKNIEIIFVENYSEDNSLEILNNIAKDDTRVVVLESKDRGTTLADKKGIEYASGKYIVFMDQDDKYRSKNALEKMYKTIKETNSDICQFSYYTYYGYGFKKKKIFTNKRQFFSSEQIRNKEIGSIFESYGGGYFSPDVWDKIYSAELVKDCAKDIVFSLFYAEDYFLNSLFFLSDKVKKVCVDSKGYYVWDNRFGFSSKDSGKALIEDYEKIKPFINTRLKKVEAGNEVFYRLHLESLYFMLAFLKLKLNTNKEHLFGLIEWLNGMEYIKLAKSYVNNDLADEKKWDELTFLASDFTPEEFYNRYKNNI